MTRDTVLFLIRAKKATYAGKGAETTSCRPGSHDLEYKEDKLMYYDTYLGGERFVGEEAVWDNGKPVWSMNYAGQVTGTPFSGDFLKEALLRVPEDKPFRGPKEYTDGTYVYRCAVEGDTEWFQGRETICLGEGQIYECFFHGSSIR